MQINKDLLKPNILIHCPEKWQAETLIVQLGWDDETKENFWEKYKEETCYRVENFKITGYGRLFFYNDQQDNILEFNDLLIKPTPSLSAKDFFQIHKEICDSTEHCLDCLLKNSCLDDWPHTNIEEMLKICSDYRNKITVELNLSNPREREIYEEIKRVQN